MQALLSVLLQRIGALVKAVAQSGLSNANGGARRICMGILDGLMLSLNRL